VDQRQPAAPSGSAAQVFIARQPILDTRRRVFAYELLFRASDTATASGTSSSRASARVLTDAVLSFGLETLTHGRPAFINVTRELLLDGIPAALPPAHVVVELLETIEADPDVVAACRELRRVGYRIALDDFVLTERTEALVPLADIIKVDFHGTPEIDHRRQLTALGRSHGLSLLAEKIETVEQFDLAAAEGFEYFQGYFFGRPVTQGAREIPTDQLGYFRLLRALHDPDLSVQKLEGLVRHDASLCFRVLRTVNSAAFGQRKRVESIQQALILMGVDAIRRWASLWILAGLNDRAHPEVLHMASVRARACELLSQTVAGPDTAPSGFLLGMCSLLDVILGVPMPSVLESLPLPAGTAAALSGDDTPQRRLLDCVTAYEQGLWDRCLILADRAGLDPAALPAAHQAAVRWSSDFTTGA
jgi:EAL and modified HD-GYP domain-containing signal transduction protein